MSDPKIGTGKKPKNSGRRLYTDENPADTIPIKFSTLVNVNNTIKMLESLYRKEKYPHIRISQVANVLEQRLRFMKGKTKEHSQAKRYTDFLKKRTRTIGLEARKKLRFKF
jgi:DNA-binding transcriptional MerR regulator